MTPKARKLMLQAERIRSLTPEALVRVAGGMSSRAADACSTWDPAGDQGCIPTNASVCGSGVAHCSDTCPI